MAKTRWARDYTRDIIDAKERFDDAKEHLKEPPDGQVPLNDWGIYTSPNLQSNEPVSPFDCEKYPDSPYCGGNPWTRTPVGLEPEWGFDECGAWVEITPVMGFTKLPPVSVGWRRPGECREEETPPPPTPPPDDESLPVSPLSLPKNIDPNVNVFIILLNTYRYSYSASWGNRDSYGPTPNTSTIWVSTTGMVDATYPGGDKKYYSYFPDPSTGLSRQVGVIGGGKVQTTLNYSSTFWEYDFSTYPPTPVILPSSYSNSGIYEGWITSDHDFPQTPNWKRYIDRGTKLTSLKGRYYIINMHQGDFGALNTSVAIYGRLSEIAKDWEGYVTDIAESTSPVEFGGVLSGGYGARIYKEQWEIGYISIPDKRKFPPPGDQRKKKKCCMQCCSNNQQNNKQNQDLSEIKRMLKEIKKGVDEAKKRIGTEEFPVSLPTSLNVTYSDSGKRSEPGMTKEESLTSLVGRFIRYFDGVMGEMGVAFKVADADPTKPGDQPKIIVARNFSQIVEEIYSHVFDIWIMQYQFLQLDQRHAIESMLARKVGIQNYYLIQSLIDWAGFKTKDITKKVPFLFDIDGKDFENFLKNKEQEIQVPDFDPDDEGADSFPDHLIRLKRAAAIIEAVHTSKFKNSDDIPKKMMEMLLNTSKAIDRVSTDELTKAGSKEDFDQWLRDAETAFINRVGQGDVNNPYGVPYAERPRLTKISDTEEEEEQS